VGSRVLRTLIREVEGEEQQWEAVCVKLGITEVEKNSRPAERGDPLARGAEEERDRFDCLLESERITSTMEVFASAVAKDGEGAAPDDRGFDRDSNRL